MHDQHHADEVDAIEETDDPGEVLEELIDDLEQIDPDNLSAVGCVVSLKEPQAFEGSDGEPTHGFVVDYFNPRLDGYSDTFEVLASIVSFNERVEGLPIPVERPNNPLSSLLG